MINIITNLEKVSDKKVIRDASSFLNLNVLVQDFDELDLYAMSKIDKAKLLDKNIGTIQTPFGITNITNLSMGCKIVLVYLYMRRNIDKYADYILDITECGSNALEVLFECMDKLGDSSVVLLLRHSDGIELCTDREFAINGNNCTHLAAGVALYG